MGEVQEGEQMLTILLRNTKFKDNNIDLIKNQPVYAPDGSYKPLQYFAEVILSTGDPELTREDLKSNIEVTARLENRDLGSAINEIRLSFPKMYLFRRDFISNMAEPMSSNRHHSGNFCLYC